MTFSAKLGKARATVHAFVARAAARYRRPESLISRAKQMISAIPAETLLAISPHPALTLATQPAIAMPNKKVMTHIMLRSGEQPSRMQFNVRQMLLSDASFKIKQAGHNLAERMRKAADQKVVVQEGSRRSWVTEWRKVFDGQIATIKASRLPKDEKVSAIKELIEDLKHYSYLTEKEKNEIINAQNELLAAFTAQS